MNLQNELEASVDYHDDCLAAIEKALNFENEKFESHRSANIVSAIKELRRTVAHLTINKIFPNALYPVKYVIHQNGDKEFGDFRIKGSDLTENQIIELALRGGF